ncbi:MAG: hypothetical protein OEY06_08435 [Gammaproteobacteria bacterium]|nr:hypothetical protein [Gammaproteobacteria bacterium]
MPHTLIWETDGLYRKFTGEISTVEILNSNFKLHEHPEFKNIKYIINDFTEVTVHSVEDSHTSVFANTDEIIANTKGKLKIAIFIIQPNFISLVEKYCEEMKHNRFDCRMFKNIEDAREWVN